MMEGALLRSVPLTSALRGSKTLKCWKTLKCCYISVPLAEPEPMLTPCTGTGQAGAGAPRLIYGFRPFLGLRVSTGASGQCSSAHRMSPFWERRLGVKQETWVSTLEVEYLTLYPRQLIGMQQARCIKCPAQEKCYTFAERHSHPPLPDPGLCKDLSFWFKHSSNCYQMCMSGPWTHWQPLIGVTSLGPPPAPGMGALSPCPACCACSSGSDPPADLNFCLALDLSHPCEPVCPAELCELPSLASPAGELWDGALPCQPWPSCPSLLPDNKEETLSIPLPNSDGCY